MVVKNFMFYSNGDIRALTIVIIVTNRNISVVDIP